MAIRRTLVLAAVAITIGNLAVSTVYYNFVDAGMQEIRKDFVSGVDSTMKCVEMGSDENNHPIPDVCTGGVLGRRDAYLNKRHVFRIGPWKTDRYLFDADRTFVPYFKYWF